MFNQAYPLAPAHRKKPTYDTRLASHGCGCCCESGAVVDLFARSRQPVIRVINGVCGSRQSTPDRPSTVLFTPTISRNIPSRVAADLSRIFTNHFVITLHCTRKQSDILFAVKLNVLSKYPSIPLTESSHYVMCIPR